MYRVTWMDKRGAGQMRAIASEAELERFVSTLRREATIWRGKTKIGGVEYDPDLCDDQRVRWVWWFESQGVRCCG